MDKENFKCRLCDSQEIIEILDLGIQPLANNLLNKSDLNKAEPKVPLILCWCESCALLQITETVPAVDMFSDYLYFSSFSQAWLDHAKKASERYINDFNLNEKSLVIEIASNDGYMLKNFVKKNIPSLGIEPAKNVADVAIKNNIDTIVNFFDDALAEKLAEESKKADLILANNVFAHVPNINSFIKGIKKLLKNDGRAIIEFPYAGKLIEKVEFDTIYHEHIFYFALLPLVKAFKKYDLEIFNVEKIPFHGGSLRIFIGHANHNEIQNSVKELIKEEKSKGFNDIKYYQDFANKVKKLKKNTIDLIKKLRSEGKTISAYGASAKGSTLLNYYDLTDYIDKIYDISTYKQGKLSPGLHIEILPADDLAKDSPDYTLLLTWNFAEEILKQQEEYVAKSGKFILPIPEVKILEE